MLNALWAGMILIGIVLAAFTGRLPQVTEAAINSSKEAVTLCLVMLGIMSMWTGLMKIAENAGLIHTLSKKMAPLLAYLFPQVPPRSQAMHHIATNMVANLLGLGWAATPAGLRAMEELQTLNPHKERASNAMCMFMIINMSSLQLVTMSIVAYRSQYGSANPSEIIGPGLLATTLTTVAGVIFAKCCEQGGKT